jgi:hypothetical protein
MNKHPVAHQPSRWVGADRPVNMGIKRALLP